MKPAGTAWLLVGVAAFAAYGLRPAAIDLWNPDEPRAAEVAREMRETGDRLSLHLNGKPYYAKPPLLYWLIAAQGEVTETTARLPSIAATLGLLILVGVFVRTRFGERAALLSVVVLASSPLVLWMGRRVAFDPLLTFFVTASILAFWKAGETKRWSGALLAGALAGLGVLTKGPSAIAVPVLALAPVLVLRRRGFVHAICALVACAVVVATWLVPASMSDPDFLSHTLGHEMIKHATDPWSHVQPFWYYLPTLLYGFFPWIVLIPFAMKRVRRAEPFTILCASWFVGSVILFSCLPAKREIYLLPAYPAAAMLVGLWLDQAEAPRFLTLIPDGMALLGLAALLRSLGVLPIHSQDAAVFEDRVKLPWIIAGATFLTSALLSLRQDRVARLIVFGIATLAVAICIHQLALPRFNEFKSARRLAEKMAAEAPQGARWIMIGNEQYGVIFYSRRLFESIESAESAPFGLCYGVAKREHVEALRRLGTVRVRFGGRVGHNEDLTVFTFQRSPP